MTTREKYRMRRGMARCGFLMLCMILLSLTATVATHAAELSGPTTIECSGYVHSAGDSDESQGDADSAIPHHHGGCHAAASCLPQKAVVPVLFDLRMRPVGFADATALTRWSPGPALRPPIA